MNARAIKNSSYSLKFFNKLVITFVLFSFELYKNPGEKIGLISLLLFSIKALFKLFLFLNMSRYSKAYSQYKLIAGKYQILGREIVF